MKYAPLIILCVLLAGCNASHPQNPSRVASSVDSSSLKVTDALGRSVIIPKTSLRIVSCDPSITEILYSLGAEGSLAIGTTMDDQPPAAKLKPHFNAMSTDMEPILAQNPNLIICIKDENGSLLPALLKTGIPVLELKAKDLNDVYQSIQLIGEAVGKQQKANEIVTGMRKQITEVSDTVKGLPEPFILPLYGINPCYTSGPGVFINDVINASGGRNVVTSNPTGNVISNEQVVTLNPSIIICDPYIQSQIEKEAGWSQISAVKNHRYYYDPSLLRSGPRLAQACANLAAYLHPHHAAHIK